MSLRVTQAASGTKAGGQVGCVPVTQNSSSSSSCLVGELEISVLLSDSKSARACLSRLATGTSQSPAAGRARESASPSHWVASVTQAVPLWLSQWLSQWLGFLAAAAAACENNGHGGSPAGGHTRACYRSTGPYWLWQLAWPEHWVPGTHWQALASLKLRTWPWLDLNLSHWCRLATSLWVTARRCESVTRSLWVTVPVGGTVCGTELPVHCQWTIVGAWVTATLALVVTAVVVNTSSCRHPLAGHWQLKFIQQIGDIWSIIIMIDKAQVIQPSLLLLQVKVYLGFNICYT